jgi:rhodanese-related sulfurtransferase
MPVRNPTWTRAKAALGFRATILQEALAPNSHICTGSLQPFRWQSQKCAFWRILFLNLPLFLIWRDKRVVNKITAGELANMQARGSAQLVELSDRICFWHVPGAINIPMEQIGGRIADLRIASPVVLICKSGQRAWSTAQLLKASCTDVLVLDGGTRAWRGSQAAN